MTPRSPISPKRKQLNPEAPQIPGYRCITYTEMGRFDEALADCNAALAQHPKFSTR